MDNKILNEDKLVYLLFGAIVSVGILFLPNSVVPYAEQDSWISIILGAIYPLYMIFIACFLKKHHPNKNILQLSRKYFGNYFGSVLNFLFGVLFIINLFLSPAGVSNFIRAYISQFVTHVEFISMFLLIGAYAAHKGIEVIIKLSEVVFYCGIVIFLTGLTVFQYGSILNIQPVMGAGFKNIVKGSFNSIYAYSCIELIFIVYPLFKDVKKIRKYGILTVVITCIVYTGVVFATIFYIETDLIKKTLWSTVYIVESIRFPLINNLRFIVFFFWCMLSFKSISIYYYAVDAVLKDIFRTSKIHEYYLIIYPFAILAAARYKNEIVKRAFGDKALPYVFVYNIVYVTVIAIIVLIKRDDSCEG